MEMVAMVKENKGEDKEAFCFVNPLAILPCSNYGGIEKSMAKTCWLGRRIVDVLTRLEERCVHIALRRD